MRQHRTAVAVALFVAAVGVRLQTAAPVGATAKTASTASRAEAAALDAHALAVGRIAASDAAAPTASTAPDTSSDGGDPAPEAGSPDASAAPAGGGPATSAAGSVETTGSRSTRTTASPKPAPVSAPVPAAARVPAHAPAPAPAAVAPAATAPATTSVSPSAAEAQMLALINGERAHAGLAALRLNSGGMSVARGWSSAMAAHRLDHNPNLVAALAQAGVGDWRSVAENVGQGESVDQIHIMFMGSPMHRANILGSQLSQVGIGVVTNGGQVFVTLDFLGW